MMPITSTVPTNVLDSMERTIAQPPAQREGPPHKNDPTKPATPLHRRSAAVQGFNDESLVFEGAQLRTSKEIGRLK